MLFCFWGCGREVEGTPLLREHTAYTRIEGSNPSIPAKSKNTIKPCAFIAQGFFVAYKERPCVLHYLS